MWILLIAFLLTGCGAETTFETVADEWVQSAAVPMRQVFLILPEEAAVPVSENENGRIYQCEGYDIYLQTLASGDLEATLKTVTGYNRKDLTVMETSVHDVKRYDLVWSCMGESGTQVGRACVLDDGNYHYVLTVLSEADRARELEKVISDLFAGYSLEG